MTDALESTKAICSALDGLEIAAYLLDENDCALHWNRTFLRFFPEHADRLQVGEPYRDNLRRFYERRLGADERGEMERYIEEGVVRNREQTRPFAFEHGGRRLHASSLPLAGVGRIRLWRADELRVPAGQPVPQQAPAPGDAAASFDHMADGVMVADAGLRILSANDAFAAMYGLPNRGAAVGLAFDDLYRAAWGGAVHAEGSVVEAGLALLAEQMRFAGAPFELPLPAERWARVIEQRSPDGRRFFVHVDISTMKQQQRRLVAAERLARDNEVELQRKSALLEATLERMEQGVMMVNAARIVEVCNRRAADLLGLPAEMMAARPSFEAVLAYQWAHNEFDQTPPDIQQFIRSGGILDRRQCYERRRPDGRVIEVQSVPLDGGGVLRTYTDISERKRTEERMRHIARHDGLTTLVNREVFLEHLAGAVDSEALVREGFAVHFIDLDRFKPINDRFGHAIGDKVLAIVAERMRKVTRDVDIVARMGGDEFAMLQFGVVNAEAALGLARRLLLALAQPMAIEAEQVQVGASIGIALCNAPGCEADTLLREADTAMYAAKSAGRDTARVYAHEAPGAP